ncbi:hypothetical protein PGT21_015660 [Puccinia graminis f. sp. tritici]|uniref:Uncharacterized protein n=1 Tax=Puccinia graminis f. sp. tritici TaxID=56615 RepID=A0A5B0LWA0_PUCGR|nr:hypothetical protein PGT21_015660 [Puccinia graminis f. sp. tritici]
MPVPIFTLKIIEPTDTNRIPALVVALDACLCASVSAGRHGIALYCKPEDHSRSALIPVGHRATEVGSSTTTKKPTLREDTGLLLGPVWAVSTVYLGLDPQAGTLVANHDKLAILANPDRGPEASREASLCRVSLAIPGPPIRSRDLG